MSRLLIIPTGFAALFLIFFWWTGGFDQLAGWAAAEQRAFQNQMARGLRNLRAGEVGAFAALLSVCFAYGFFHAVGPGHGKVLIGGYGLGRKVPWLRLSVISLLASLGQAVTAVVLVYAGIALFGLARSQMVGVTEDILAPASYAAIGLIGAWLVWRGLRRIHAVARHHGHDHTHEHDEACQGCGHKHGPDLKEIKEARSLRDAMILISGISIRPCTGALFVLIITWQMGIAAAGVAGAFAMALGTATVTIAVGLTAVGLRGGLATALSGTAALTWLVPMIEILAGLLIAAVASGLYLRALS